MFSNFYFIMMCKNNEYLYKNFYKDMDYSIFFNRGKNFELI